MFVPLKNREKRKTPTSYSTARDIIINDGGIVLLAALPLHLRSTFYSTLAYTAVMEAALIHSFMYKNN